MLKLLRADHYAVRKTDRQHTSTSIGICSFLQQLNGTSEHAKFLVNLEARKVLWTLFITSWSSYHCWHKVGLFRSIQTFVSITNYNGWRKNTQAFTTTNTICSHLLLTIINQADYDSFIWTFASLFFSISILFIYYLL